MAFSILLQQNNSEDNRVTKNVNTIASVNGVLKDDTSIIDPVILIRCDLSSVVNCNYMTIPSFNRSYFVRNIKSVRNGLVEFNCHVDVLSSFADSIKGNSAIIKRQENDWNLYLNDGTLRVYQNSSVLTKSFPSGFNKQEFVLAVAK